jgi:cytochrome c oxidase cbb3-type subunit 1
LLATLFPVPFLLYWAAGPEIYPVVNPDSGGATGASLLGSTLGLLAIFGLIPWLLRLAPREGSRSRQVYAAALALTLSCYAGISHGHASHHRLDQIIGLGLLLAWIPLVWFYARSFAWRPVSRCWLGAAFVWWALLVGTGLLTFLPGISERLKFTNALVAHSHLAMAGMVTSLHIALLLNLGPARPLRSWTFWVWQLGCGVQVAALLWLGWWEGADPFLLSVRGGLADTCYGLRFIAGGVMLATSALWWWDRGRTIHEPQKN